MEEFSEIQKEIISLLLKKGMAREDIFSIMLVLTCPEKSEMFLNEIKTKENANIEEYFEIAGKIAYGEEK